jgi:lon-related putative ATP-dependent protease
MNAFRLSPEELCRACSPSDFGFETTSELEELTEIVGQDRAVEAIRFGIGMRRDGYNLFLLGPSGTGKRTTVTKFLEQKAASEPVPSDWCYVTNFEVPHKPQAIELPAGKAVVLKKDMENLIDELRTAIPAAFESEDYRNRKQEIEEEAKERQEEAFNVIQQEARDKGISLLRTPVGLAFAPIRDGEVVSPDEFRKLPEEEQKRLESDISKLQERLQGAVHELRDWQREAREKVKQLDQQMAKFAVEHLIEELQASYREIPEIVEYLDAVEKDIIEQADQFRQPQEAPESLPAQMARAGIASAMRRYEVNVIVDHSQSKGAPVIYENHPTYNNLMGRTEHIAQMGALTTDFTLIKPGALHLANGGYLILDARELLLQPYSWEGLKRSLRSRLLTIEPLGQALSLISTISLQPEPIPLDAKIVLVGERRLYYMLFQLDPDFGELFKVQADFSSEIDLNPENRASYAKLIGTVARKENLRPLNAEAVARVIERGSRLSGDSEKLSVQLSSIADLLRESDYWAAVSGNELIHASDVQRAVDAQIRRADRARELSLERIAHGTKLIDTDGEHVGQINGLSVLGLGNFSFGQPSRITARVRMGKGKVIDIEREVEMGGPIHSKGVLILSSYLAARYALDQPLSLSANLVFEQSYGGVEGDSASVAELCALLSALSGTPIRQSLAITGSVNQHGYAQPIGGVNEKIEGFFDVCRMRGLTGDQGVIIPSTNVRHLMLKREVVEAVKASRFHIYAINSVDEAIMLLTGLEAGERDDKGEFPAGSLNHAVEARLISFAETQRRFAEAAGQDTAEDAG